MHIVLDSNAIIAEQFGSSPRFRALLDAADGVGYTVYPQSTEDMSVAVC